MKSKIYCAHGSKLVLAIALLLIFSLVLSPLVVAAKDSKKGNGNDGQDGTSDNVKEPQKGRQDDNNIKDGKDGKENHANKDKHGSENNTPVDNNSDQDQPDLPDNDVPDQPDNEILDQPDNDVPDQPDQPDNPIQDQPEDTVQDQPNQPDIGGRNQPEQLYQPANSVQNDQILTIENQPKPDTENFPENQEVEILEPNEPVQQSAKDSQPQELSEGLSDQSSSQQAGATVTSTVSNVVVSFSEGLPVLSVGFGIIVVFRLFQVWAYQRYLLQLIRFRISLMDSISPFYKILSRVNQIEIHLGKIKCGKGFTKEEALAYFRKCQRLPLSFNRSYR